MSKGVRWGVLSTSNIGRAAVNPAIARSRNGELWAVASREASKAQAFGEEGGFERWYGSYAALLADPAVDAVYIPLPNKLHLEWAIRAMDRGKHVLCEKPLALDAAECREMESAAKSNGVKLMEAFMYRFHPQTGRVLELLASGTIGEVRTIRSCFTFKLTRPDNIRWSAELGGGALMDVGCYCVNVSRTMAGVEPYEVQAWADWGSTGVDQALVGSMRFKNGVMAHFDCALTMDRRETYEVAGTDGSLLVPAAYLPGTEDTVIQELHGATATEHVVPGADEYQLMVEHFADCVMHDRPPRYSASEAASNMQVIEALLQSARSGGMPVEVDAG